VIKRSSISKKSVELDPTVRVSRIRREPPAQVQKKALSAHPTEREVWTVVIGVCLFALAISFIIFQGSAITGH
jgi:hypothetical protein